MPPGVGPTMVRVAAVIPVVLLVLFTGLLWVLGLLCDRERRRYVTDLSQQAIGVIGAMLHGPPACAPPRHQQQIDS
jgi:hypothetical protein